jgi:hypothetical protein
MAREIHFPQSDERSGLEVTRITMNHPARKTSVCVAGEFLQKINELPGLAWRERLAPNRPKCGAASGVVFCHLGVK